MSVFRSLVQVISYAIQNLYKLDLRGCKHPIIRLHRAPVILLAMEITSQFADISRAPVPTIRHTWDYDSMTKFVPLIHVCCDNRETCPLKVRKL